MPQRIQRKRTKGFRLPPNTICVSRPSRWGNPFRLLEGYTSQQAVDYFRELLANMPPELLEEYLAPLRGKNLACWCALDQPHCHARILLSIANDIPFEEIK